MKTKILLLWGVLLLLTHFNLASQIRQPSPVKTVASFTGQQVTGVTVTDEARLFANFPRWRSGVENSVIEIKGPTAYQPYPDQEWNTWEIGKPVSDEIFVAVQSVVAAAEKLYVLDTRNPMFKGVIDQPRIFVFDLNSDELDKVYILPPQTFKPNSYINDLRIDLKHKTIYLTDSGAAGLVVIDMVSGQARRVLDNHYSTLAEVDHLTINGKKWENTVHSDGIALQVNSDTLYYHSLTGYSLYAVPAAVLRQGDENEIAASVRFVRKTPAPDGMIFDQKNNLYLADLEKNKIVYLTPKGRLRLLIKGKQVSWADSFSIHKGELYYTNSRIHEASGDISKLVFTINKIRIR